MKNAHLVKASAGSGKTFFLTLQYLKTALSFPDGGFSGILAMTFTNNAVNELKQRILAELEKLQNGEGSNYAPFLSPLFSDLQERAEKLLANILHNYSDFHVSTLDHFSYSLLLSQRMDLEINYDIEISLDKDSFQEKVLLTTLDILSKSPEKQRGIKEILRAPQSKYLNITAIISSCIHSVLSEPFGIQHKEMNQLKSVNFSGIVRNIFLFLQEQDRIFDDFSSKLEKRLSIIHEAGLKEKDLYRILKKIKDKDRAFLSGDFGKNFSTILEKQDFFNAKTEQTGTVQNINQELSTFFETFETHVVQNGKKYFTVKEILSNLGNMYLSFWVLNAFQEIQKKEGVLYISQVNTILFEHLFTLSADFIFEKIGTKVNTIFLDEFQDTSLLQWYNLLPLIEEVLSVGGNVVSVGDPKQSIYRFRGGAQELITSFPKPFNPYSHRGVTEKYRGIKQNFSEETLQNNYRSSKEVIAFNNLLYSSGFPEYFSDSSQNCFRKEGGYVKLYTALETDDEEELELFFEDLMELKSRKQNMNNVAVLCATKKDLAKVKNCLEKKGVSCVSQELFTLKASSQVAFVRAFCSFLGTKNELYKFQCCHLLDLLECDASWEEIFETCSHIPRISTLCSKLLLFLTPHKTGIDEYASAFISLVYDFENTKNPYDIDAFVEYCKKIELQPITVKDTEGVQLMTIHKAKGLEFSTVFLPFFNWRFEKPHASAWFWAKNPLKEMFEIPSFFISRKKGLLNTLFSKEYEIEQERMMCDNYNAMYVATTRARNNLYVYSTSKSKKLGEAKTVFSSLYPFFSEGYIKGDVFIEEETVSVSDESSFLETPPFLKSVEIQHKKIIETDEISFGNAFHYWVSKITNSTDFNKIQKRVLKKEPLYGEEIIKKIKKVITNPSLSKYYAPEKRSFNEKEIVLEENATLIFDRIVFEKQGICVIDFKTGGERPEHSLQMERYVKELSNIYSCSVKGLLVYFSHKDIFVKEGVGNMSEKN